MKRTKRFLIVVLSLMALLAFGCSKDTNYSVGTPNPNILYPTGTVQGILKDACTNSPIAGAIIDIGVATATTNDRGQYVMYNVPATDASSDVAAGVTGHYSVTIDMRNAYSTVDKITNYPQFSYDEVAITFSSLGETKGTDVNATLNTTNHDSPVVGLGNGDYDFVVGQLKTSISGVAVTPKLATVPAGYTVNLYSLGRGYDGNSTTGDHGHLIATTTTTTAGAFTFPGLETKMPYGIEVIDTATAAPAFRGWEWARTKCEGTTYFGVQDGDPVVVYPTDVLCPFIVSSSPIMWEDMDANVQGGINVTFTFSEPIKATPLNTGVGLTASAMGSKKTKEIVYGVYGAENGLYYDVFVGYMGNKYGNIPHTLSWNAAMTVLTVNIPTVSPAAYYQVSIMSGQNLTDAAGNPLSSMSAVSKHINTCSTFLGYGVIFSTYGAVAASAPVLTVRDPLHIDYDTMPTISWTPTTGSKSFNIYCQQIQWDGTNATAGNVHPYFLMYNTDQAAYPMYLYGKFSNLSDRFIENDKIKLSYQCYVRGVNADGLEGAASNIITLADVVAPVVSSSSYKPVSQGTTPSTIGIGFDEPMAKTTVEDVTNWTLNPAAFSGTGPTIAKVQYNVPSESATIFLSGGGTLIDHVDATSAQVSAGLCGTPAPAINFLSTGAMTDVAGNALTAQVWSFIVNYGGDLCI